MNFNKDEKEESEKIQKVKHIIGAAMLIKRKVIDKIGVLDFFFPCYGEEIDYCERARKNGFDLYYDPRVTIVHIRAQSIDARKNTTDWFVMKRQSIKVELLNYPRKEILYWWMVHFAAVFLHKNGRKIEFHKDFPSRFNLLIKAYMMNLKELSKILYKRSHRDEKIWVLNPVGN